MEVTITLNGKKITDVKPETAGFAAFYWMENQCFPAAFQSDVHQEEK